MNLGTILEKQFAWFFTAWWIWYLTKLDYNVKVDKRSVFSDSIEWNGALIEWLWEIWGWEIWVDEIGWAVEYEATLTPFEKMADAGRIYRNGIRVQIEISSTSDIQDFIIDLMWVMATMTNHLDINNKF